MCPLARAFARSFALLLLAFSCEVAWGQTTVPSKPDASGSPYKVLRSVSGAAGHENNGRYVMDDARSVFVAGKDPKVIVYFEWQGPIGPHHFEGLWKSPEGKIVLISDFRYEAKAQQFNGYWSMVLSDATPSGEWQLEARIDGEFAGTHTFVITGSAAAGAPPSTPQPLGAADLYRKAMDATVTIEKLAADGVVLGKGNGFWVGDARVLTAFDVIDGAASLRVSLKDGSQLTTDQVLAWNRWQDWALLKLDGGAKTWLKRGASDTPNVGDHCVFLEAGPVGAKLADGSITGKSSFPKAGERLIIASGVTSVSFGGPLLDEYGNYVGILGGSIVPGGDPIKTLSLLNDAGATDRTTDWTTTGLAVPHTQLPDLAAAASTTRLAELAKRGEFLLPVVKSKSVQFVTLAGQVAREPSKMLTPRDFKQVFSRRDVKAYVYVNWDNSSKGKLNCVLRLFDADNKLISETETRQVTLAPGKYIATSWDLSIANSRTGIFRLDLILDGVTVWREFFRITE
ncbi:MAG TPA: serine protease [Verrucomicrobiae bacterium]|nr:serine protease [Verrucomicrobiae bacterium]